MLMPLRMANINFGRRPTVLLSTMLIRILPPPPCLDGGRIFSESCVAVGKVHRVIGRKRVEKGAAPAAEKKALMSIFAAQPQGARGGLFEMQCGKATLAGSTVTADPRKGLLSLKKSEDGLMHLVWKDRTSNAVDEDLIVFPGDATLRHLAQCQDGYVMLLEFTQTKRKLFFWSQERRKKGLEFSNPEDISKEKALLEKANRALNGTPEPVPAATGFGGLTHSELMAMLSGGMAPPGGAPAAAPSAGEPAAADGAAPSSGAAAAAAPGAAAPSAGAPAPFSSDAISSILGNLGTPGAAAPAPAAPANFTAANLSNILAAVQQSGAQPGAPRMVMSSCHALLSCSLSA